MTMTSGASLSRSCWTSGARIFSGWCTGRCAASATSFTGETEICCPRPRGRSGCEMTPKTSNSGRARRCLSVGTANWGVPQNRRRMVQTFPAETKALRNTEGTGVEILLKQEDAIEVIDFMAEGARQEVFAANFKRLAFDVLCFHSDELRTHDVAAKAGNREAALFLADFAFGVGDFGVGQNDFGFGIFPAGHVHHRETYAFANLWGGQANALRGIHGGKHVFGKIFEFGVKFLHRRAGPFEHRIAVLDDGIDFARRRRRLWRLGGGNRRCFRTR